MTEIPSSLYERIGAMDQKINAAHTRQDRSEERQEKFDKEIKELLKDLKKDIMLIVAGLDAETKKATASINRSEGWRAGALFVASAVGAAVALLIKSILK